MNVAIELPKESAKQLAGLDDDSSELEELSKTLKIAAAVTRVTSQTC